MVSFCLWLGLVLGIVVIEGALNRFTAVVGFVFGVIYLLGLGSYYGVY